MSKFGTPAFSEKMKTPQTAHVANTNPQAAFEDAINAPVSNRAIDIGNALGLVSFALSVHKHALETAPNTVVGRGRMTGLTKKMEAINSQLALGLEANQLRPGSTTLDATFKRTAAEVMTTIQEINTNVFSGLPVPVQFTPSR